MDHMQLAIGIVAALLAGWFFGCIITYKVGNRILVEGMGIKSAEFIMLVLYGAGGGGLFLLQAGWAMDPAWGAPVLGRCAILLPLVLFYLWCIGKKAAKLS